MRTLGAIAISLSGAVASFIGVLAALEGTGPAPGSAHDHGRLAQFAVAGLPTEIATATPSNRQTRAAVAGNRGAWVPPIARKKLIDPASPAVVADAAAPQQSQQIVAPKPVPAPRIARAKRPPGQPLETTTRSALGGPRPATGTP
jgi:hypothetical protein